MYIGVHLHMFVKYKGMKSLRGMMRSLLEGAGCIFKFSKHILLPYFPIIYTPVKTFPPTQNCFLTIKDEQNLLSLLPFH